MTKTRYGVCPKCNMITYKKELTSTTGVTESVSYREDKTCECKEVEKNTEVKLEVK